MGWNKRKLIRIYSAATLTNYQLRIVVSRNTEDVLIPDGLYNGENRIYAPEASEDFSDIRFFTHANGAISAYLDSITDDRAVWWLKVPTLYQGNTTIYILYDNPDATLQTTDAVFDFVEKYDGTLPANWKGSYSGGQYANLPDVKTAWTIVPVPSDTNPIEEEDIEPWVDNYTNESERFTITYLEPVEGTNWEKRFWMNYGPGGLRHLNASESIAIGYHLSVEKYGHVSVTVGNYLYIIGGHDFGLDNSLIGYEVNPNTGVLTLLTGLPTLSVHRTAHTAVAVGNYIYVIGCNPELNMDLIEGFEVDLEDGSLTPLTGLPTLSVGRDSPVAASVGNRIYVFGGQTLSGQYLNTIEGFEVDLEDGSLTSFAVSATIGTARSVFGIASVGRRIYLFGGVNGSGTVKTISGFLVNYTDGSLTAFSPGLSLTTDNIWYAITSFGTSIFVCGGCVCSGGGTTSLVIEGYEVNQNNGTLVRKTGMPALWYGKNQTSVSVIGKYIYVIGGFICGGGSETDLIDILYYDAEVGTYAWPLQDNSVAVFRDESPFDASLAAGGAYGATASVAYYGTETDQVMGLRILHEMLHATGLDPDQMVDNDRVPFGNYLTRIEHEDAEEFNATPELFRYNPDMEQVYYEWLLASNTEGGIYISGGAVRTTTTIPLNRVLTIYGSLTIVDGTTGFGLADASGNAAFFGNSVTISPVVANTETGVSSTYTRNALSATGEHIFEIVRTASFVKFYVDGILIKEHTTNIPQGSLPISYICTGFESEVWISQIFVRTYAATEPYIRYSRIEDPDLLLGWLPNLRCRRLITVTNTGETNFNHVQRTRICRNPSPVPTILYNLHLNLNGKCRSDFRDIQFTEMDGVTVIENYMEYATENHADFVLKIPVRYNGTTNLYLYYNGERLRSDPVHKRFADLMYEGFDAISSLEWNQVGTVSGDGSVVSVDANESSPYTHNYLRSKDTYSGPVRMVSRIKFDTRAYEAGITDWSLFGFVGTNLADSVGLLPQHINAETEDGRPLDEFFDGEYHIVAIQWGYANPLYMIELDSEPYFSESRFYPGTQSNDLNIMISAFHRFLHIDVDWLFLIPYALAGDRGLTYGAESQLFVLLPPDFTWSDPVIVDEPVTFSLTNQNSFVAWDFGDGFISYESTPVHTYHNPGTYTVTLKAADSDGNPQLTVSHELEVQETGYLGYDVNFDASARFGQVPLTIQFYNESPDADSWLWDFGDGETSTERHPAHTYENPQTYTVKLVATTSGESFGNIKEDFVRATELDIPVADFTIDPDVESVQAPASITLTDASTGTIETAYWEINDVVYENNPLSYPCIEPGMLIIKRIAKNADWIDERMTSLYVMERSAMRIYPTPKTGVAPAEVEFRSFIPFRYRKVLWDFGDESTSSDLIPTHTFTEDGVYTVTLTVWKETSTYPVQSSIQYTVIDPAILPVPDFSASVTEGAAPLEVTFTNLSTGDIDSRLWNFGDGSTSTLENPVHTYTADGEYTVSLTATNEYGSRTETKTAYINCHEPPIAAFMATFTGTGYTSPTAADMMPPDETLEVAFTDLSENRPTAWLWEFGDTEESEDQNPEHTYDTIGRSYWAELTVTNSAGSDTIGMDITILPDDYTIPEFSYQILTHQVPFAVSFTPAGYESTDDHIWEFGDGETSRETEPVHEYLYPGTYIVIYRRVTDTGVVSRKMVIEVI